MSDENKNHDARFRPGQSGNPGGRPKGARNVRQIVDELMAELFSVTINGQIVLMPAREIMIRRVLQNADKDDQVAIDFLLKYMPEDELNAESVTVSDKNILHGI